MPPEGTAATIQRLMLYVIPVGVLASGLLFNFPLGVLLYWFTSNLWTLGQQAYIIRFHPHDRGADASRSASWARRSRREPGQRPVRDARDSGARASGDQDRCADADEPRRAGDRASGAGAAPRTARASGRTGAAGKTTAGKRPTQAKKRR